MQKIFVSSLLLEVESLKEMLEQEGIPCTIKNQQGTSLGGEVPFAEVFPELWVVNNGDLPRAQEFLENWRQAKPAETTSWTCSSCGESHEKDFTTCWKCGRDRTIESVSNRISVPKPRRQDQNNVSTVTFIVGMILGGILTLFIVAIGNYYFPLEGNSYDRNHDGKMDMIYSNTGLFSFRGAYTTKAKSDNDFNGIYETWMNFDKNGILESGRQDHNQDGKADVIWNVQNGIVISQDILDLMTGSIRKRQFFKFELKFKEEIDLDGDGEFDQTIHFDEYENPIN